MRERERERGFWDIYLFIELLCGLGIIIGPFMGSCLNKWMMLKKE